MRKIVPREDFHGRLALAALLVFCFLIRGQAQVMVAIGRNFKGIAYGNANTNSPILPPDANGAIGPSHYVELINGRFSVFNKTNGSLVQTLTDSNFWRNAGVNLPIHWVATDPRIIYDRTVQRWFASEVDIDLSSLSGGCNHFLLAVSAGANPTGAWKGVSFFADPFSCYSADFPTLGLDDKGVYLAAEMFNGSGTPVGSTLVSLSKSDLLAVTPIITNRTRFPGLSHAERGYVLQAAVCMDGTSTGKVLSTGGLGFEIGTGDPVTNSTLVGFAVQNAAGPGSATLSGSTMLPVPGYTAPLSPIQPDGTTTLDDNDSRFSAFVYAVGGVLHAVQGTQINNHAAIRWYRISATNLALIETGTLSDTNLDLFYPSIAVNALGVAVIGCNGSSSNSFVSCYAFVGQTANGVTTFGNRILLKAGTANYHGDDEAFTGDSRWGDYSSTGVDPTDPNRFWTLQMYPSGTNVWATQITEVLTGVPQLSIAVAGNNVVISWPGTAIPFILEANTSLTNSNGWTNIPQNLTTNFGVVSAIQPATGAGRLFRLFHP